MVLLFSAAELVVWLVFFLVIVYVFKSAIKKSAEEQQRKKDSSGTITFRVYEKPKVDWETPGDDGAKGKYSCTIPKDVEEIELLITEEDGNISADVYSLKHRGNLHEKTIFFDHVDQKNIYKVTVPPGAGAVNLIIKETDHKISVEMESVK
jgi:hypothetical protein